jgi:hypothetical protein
VKRRERPRSGCRGAIAAISDYLIITMGYKLGRVAAQKCANPAKNEKSVACGENALASAA